MKCHCCNSNYEQIYENTFSCPSCGHIFRNYNGDETKYHREQYRSIERRDNSEINKFGQIEQIFHDKRKIICDSRIDLIKDYVDINSICLDIGAGAGTFANLLNNLVTNIECTELDPSLLAECKRLGFKTYSDRFENINFDSKYDVTFAWHVLEHVSDIKSFLNKCHQITKKACIIEVPLLETLSGVGRKRTLTDPSIGPFDGHFHYFSKLSFSLAVKDAFSIVEIKEGVQSPALFSILEPK